MAQPLLGQISARTQSAPVFQGAQRADAIAALGRCIAERRTQTILQLLDKDPTLVHEVIPVPASGIGLNGVIQHMEFPLACLAHGISAGYLFALQNGLPPDTLMQDGTTTLLQSALSLSSANRPMIADISLLLGMGASPSSMPSNDCLHAVVNAAFDRRGLNEQGLATVSMLLDARFDFNYSASMPSPFQIIVRSAGWETDEGSLRMTKTMARFAKAGVDINRSTGEPKTTALLTAIGTSNRPAVLSLIHLGAKTTPDALLGRDLSVALEDAKLQDLIPEARAAMMQATMSSVVSPTPAPPAAVPAAQAPEASAPSSDRRRRRDL